MKINKSWFLQGILPFAVIIILLQACADDKGGDTADNPVTISAAPEGDDEHNARTSLDYTGTYLGTLPCGDCEGIATTVIIRADSTYTLTTEYLGKDDGKKFTTNGSWEWRDGSVIELAGITDAPNRYFVAENALIQLDLEGNRIEGDLAENYRLLKEEE